MSMTLVATHRCRCIHGRSEGIPGCPAVEEDCPPSGGRNCPARGDVALTRDRRSAAPTRPVRRVIQIVPPFTPRT